MERITFNRTLSSAVLHAWATEFNRAHREAPICASMWRLRFVALFTFGALVFFSLAGHLPKQMLMRRLETRTQ